MSPSSRLAGRLYLVASAVYIADRLTKAAAEAWLRGRPPIRVIPAVVQLNYTENPGGAFGFFGSATWLFAGATLIVCSIVVISSFRVARPFLATAMGLVLGGAVGNLTDRLVRGPGLSGRVIDFIDLRVWPVFNVADAAIVVGAGLVLVLGLWHRDRQ